MEKLSMDKLSNEVRLLIAFLLMGVVLFITPMFFPQPPVKDQGKTDAPKADTAASSRPQRSSSRRCGSSRFDRRCCHR